MSGTDRYGFESGLAKNVREMGYALTVVANRWARNTEVDHD